MGTPTRVLIVDDDLAVGQTFARMLTVTGHDVTVVQSAETAFESALASRPDVVLLDLRMPMAGGLTLLSRLRKHAELRELPAAVVTGDRFLAEQTIDDLRALGATVRFKPLSMKDLVALVDSMVTGTDRP
jgi:DNA-binding response OmpR family regulator